MSVFAIPAAIETVVFGVGMLTGILGWGMSNREFQSVPAYIFYGSNKRVTGSNPGGYPLPRKESEGPAKGPVFIPPFPRIPKPPKRKQPEDTPQSLLNEMSDNIAPQVKVNLTVSTTNKRFIGEPIHHSTVFQAVAQSAEGRSSTVEFGALGAREQWNTNTAGTPTHFQSPVRWLNLNPGQGRAAGLRYTAQQATNDDELYLTHVTQIMEFVNLGNTPAFCELLAFKCKNDTSFTPEQTLALAYADLPTGPDTTQVYPAALAVPTAAANFGSVLDDLPYVSHAPDIEQLKKFWKKLDSWKFQLAGGGRLVMNISVEMNMRGNEQELNQALTLTLCKNMLCYNLVVFGSPVLSTVPAVVGLTNTMVRSQAKVGVIISTKMKFRMTEEKQGTRSKQMTNYFGTGANNTLTNEQFMDTDQNAESDVKITV